MAIKLANDEFLNGYKIQIYPDENDAKFIDKCIDINRFMYNWTIEQEENQYQLYLNGEVDKDHKFISEYELYNRFTSLKEEFEFLKEIPRTSALSGIKRAINAYNKFFKGCCKKPKYKSKKNFNGYSYRTRPERMFFEDNMLRIEGLDKNKLIKSSYNTGLNKKSDIKFYNPTITKDRFGKYFISFNIIEKKPLNYFDDNNIPFSEEIGIDLNKKDRVVLSNGKIYKEPKSIDKEILKLKKYQNECWKDIRRIKKLERTNPDIGEISYSKKALKRKYRLSKQHRRIHNINKNFVDQTTNEIIKSRPKAIVVETLNIKGMMKNHFIAQKLHYSNFYSFKEALKRKADKFGIRIIEAPMDFPSSQICSNCGFKKINIYQNKSYNCPNCGLRINRDLNAAINLRNLALN